MKLNDGTLKITCVIPLTQRFATLPPRYSTLPSNPTELSISPESPHLTDRRFSYKRGSFRVYAVTITVEVHTTAFERTHCKAKVFPVSGLVWGVAVAVVGYEVKPLTQTYYSAMEIPEK
eukprot:1375634-Amorphochlora_amoeboformis.AAC.1